MWVCTNCGSEDIQEIGNIMETFSLGTIETDEFGFPAPPDGYDLQGDVQWDMYTFEAFECQECNASTDELHDLVVWQEDE